MPDCIFKNIFYSQLPISQESSSEEEPPTSSSDSDYSSLADEEVRELKGFMP